MEVRRDLLGPSLDEARNLVVLALEDGGGLSIQNEQDWSLGSPRDDAQLAPTPRRRVGPEVEKEVRHAIGGKGAVLGELTITHFILGYILIGPTLMFTKSDQTIALRPTWSRWSLRRHLV